MTTMEELVTGLSQQPNGVDITLGQGAERSRVDELAAKCGPGGSGCDSDCCDEEFTARVEGIDVSGVDDNVTMHLRGAVTTDEVAAKMSKCDCYDKA